MIKERVHQFFEIDNLQKAVSYLHDLFRSQVNEAFDAIDHNDNDYRNSVEYKKYIRYSNISQAFYAATIKVEVQAQWVTVNGTAHSMEEAAHIAASKWCELLFGWHLQDNGALDEETSFNMCALGTYLAESAKKDITEQAKKNAYGLFFEYYKRCKNYSTNHNGDYILTDIGPESYEWLKKNLPDPDSDNDKWEDYAFSCTPYCDYGPNITLYRILLNAGVDKKDIRSICPWKTGISIRDYDNAVLYRTYQHTEEL